MLLFSLRPLIWIMNDKSNKSKLSVDFSLFYMTSVRLLRYLGLKTWSCHSRQTVLLIKKRLQKKDKTFWWTPCLEKTLINLTAFILKDGECPKLNVYPKKHLKLMSQCSFQHTSPSCFSISWKYMHNWNLEYQTQWSDCRRVSHI